MPHIYIDVYDINYMNTFNDELEERTSTMVDWETNSQVVIWRESAFVSELVLSSHLPLHMTISMK